MDNDFQSLIQNLLYAPGFFLHMGFSREVENSLNYSSNSSCLSDYDFQILASWFVVLKFLS